MDRHEITIIQGADDHWDLQGGDGNRLPLRLFIDAGAYSAGRRGLSAGGGYSPTTTTTCTGKEMMVIS